MVVLIFIGVVLFVLFTFLIWKLSQLYYKEEYTQKMRKNWTVRTYYWQGVLFLSGVLTVASIFGLKAMAIIN